MLPGPLWCSRWASCFPSLPPSSSLPPAPAPSSAGHIWIQLGNNRLSVNAPPSPALGPPAQNFGSHRAHARRRGRESGDMSSPKPTVPGCDIHQALHADSYCPLSSGFTEAPGAHVSSWGWPSAGLRKRLQSSTLHPNPGQGAGPPGTAREKTRRLLEARW